MQPLPKNIVLVTGASGFIGSNIACDLAETGEYDIVICDDFAAGDSWKYVLPVVVHDIVTPSELLGWVDRNVDRIEAIVHMGAISATTETDVGKIIANNIRLTLDLWSRATKHDITFIYASSAATYGDGSNGFVDDDDPSALAQLAPLNAYGWSKHFVDRRLMQDVTTGKPTPTRWAGLKFFNVYGPNEGHKGSMRSVVHQIYPLAARGEVVRLFKSDNPNYPDGGQLRDFVYVKDCSAVVQRMLKAAQLSGVFNVGTGRARSFADLAGAVFDTLGVEPRIEYVDMPKALKGKYQYFTEASSKKLSEAGLSPGFRSLEDGVEDYVDHLRHELA